MRRNEFLNALSRALNCLKADEKERYVANYAELLDDKLDAGINEEAAIAELGDPAAIAGPIIADAMEQGTLRPKRNPLTTGLLILCSPVLLALAAAVFSALLALYITVWALILSVCALELSLAVILPAAIIYFTVNVATNLPFSLFVLGIGLVCAAGATALWRPILGFVSGFAVYSTDKVRRFIADLKVKGSALL